jgi:alkylation response protein AidB-like acyl-CoA dehydrogenase
MAEAAIDPAVVLAIRSGDEALDRGLRGPAPELALLRGAGLLMAPLPAPLGGQGWGTSAQGALPMLRVLMTLGGASLPVARIYEGHVNALKLIFVYGTDAQQDSVAAAVRGGALLGVWGADSPHPVAIESGHGAPVLTGTKAFASGLGDVDLAIIIAGCTQGLQMVIANASETSRAQHADWDVAAMVGSRSGSFDCAGIAAGKEARLGPVDALLAEPDFHGGLWRLAACYAGALARIAVLTADASERRGAPTPLMESRIAQLAIEAESAEHWARRACSAAESGQETSERAVYAAVFAREAIEQCADRALAIAERANGTALHRRTSEVGRHARNLRFYLRQADLDGKLAMAARLWMQSRLHRGEP